MNESQIPHLTVDGDRAGDYVVREERADGTLVLQSESAWAASLRRRGLRPATPDEFEKWVAEHGPLQQ